MRQVTTLMRRMGITRSIGSHARVYVIPPIGFIRNGHLPAPHIAAQA